VWCVLENLCLHNQLQPRLAIFPYLQIELFEIKVALSAISGYQLFSPHYAVVVDVLKQRFGNPQLIVDAHYQSLSHLPVATNQTASLRQCYDTNERHLWSLEAAGENVIIDIL